MYGLEKKGALRYGVNLARGGEEWACMYVWSFGVTLFIYYSSLFRGVQWFVRDDDE